MSSSELSALLLDAPVGRHFAQLHQNSEDLVEAGGRFIEAGLRRGNGVVVIASATNTELFLRHLRQSDLDPEAFRRRGQLNILDARAVLGRFTRGDMPNWVDFRRTIGTVLEEARAFGRNITRVYGEMVNILWREGRAQAAIQLEEYWNELARLYPFSLFCGYMLDSLDEESYARPLQDIGRTHSDIIATQEDERFRVALDAASRDIYGIPLSELLSLSGHEHNPGEHRLPSGQRTMLWIMRSMPASSAQVLDLARLYYQNSTGPACDTLRGHARPRPLAAANGESARRLPRPHPGAR